MLLRKLYKILDELLTQNRVGLRYGGLGVPKIFEDVLNEFIQQT